MSRTFRRSGLMAAGVTALAVALPVGIGATPTASAPQPATALAKYTNCNASGQAKNPDLTIAFAQTDLNTPWRVGEMTDFKLWAKKLCIPNFIFNQANEDVAKQLSNVSDLLAKKPDVLILDPMATKPLVPAVDLAAKANVPLVVVDRALSVQPGTQTYQVFIGADQFPIGYNSAKLWIQKLKQVQKTNNPKANLAIIDGGVGQDPAIERHKGVLAAIKPYKGIKVVASQSGNWTRDGGRKVMQAFIQRFPAGHLQGVFTASDEEMIGARQALAAAHRTDLNGWFFTGDGQLQGLEAIAAGINVADTQNSPFYGQPSLQAAVAISQGVTFKGETFNLVNETFHCLTKPACAKVKAYVAKIKLAGLLF